MTKIVRLPVCCIWILVILFTAALLIVRMLLEDRETIRTQLNSVMSKHGVTGEVMIKFDRKQKRADDSLLLPVAIEGISIPQLRSMGLEGSTISNDPSCN